MTFFRLLFCRVRGDQDGWTIVTAMMVVGLMLSVGLAGYGFVGGQQAQSAAEGASESSFNLSDGLLASQSFVLSSYWPGTPLGTYPDFCATGATDHRCPSQQEVEASFDSADYAAETGWITHVRDDDCTASAPAAAGCASSPYYRDAILQNPRYDANQNGVLWIRAESVVREERRVVVGQVEVEKVIEEFPRHLATSGSFATGNNGNKGVVDTGGGDGLIAVRCPDAGDLACFDDGKDKKTGEGSQIVPAPPASPIEVGWEEDQVVPDDALYRLERTAISLGTYFDGCPSSKEFEDLAAELSEPRPQPTARVVFVDQRSSPKDCKFTGNDTFFSPAAPGMLVVAGGTFTLGGNAVLHGLIYAPNPENRTDDVITVTGNAKVYGSLAVDGPGGVLVGQSGNAQNLIWEPKLFDALAGRIALSSYGAVRTVPGGFRELPAG